MYSRIEPNTEYQLRLLPNYHDFQKHFHSEIVAIGEDKPQIIKKHFGYVFNKKTKQIEVLMLSSTVVIMLIIVPVVFTDQVKAIL